MQKLKPISSQQNQQSQPSLMKEHTFSTPHYLEFLKRTDVKVYEVVSSSHNGVYLSIIYFYVSQILFEKEDTLGNLKIAVQNIQIAQLMIVDKQTLPKYLQQIYEFKSLKSALLTSLQKIANCQSNSQDLKAFVRKILMQPLTILSFVLLFRQLTMNRYILQKQQDWIIGNQEKCLKDFRQDARGNVLRLISQQLNINIKLHVHNRITKASRDNTYLQKQSKHTLSLLLEQNKTFIVESEDKQKQSKITSKQNQITQAILEKQIKGQSADRKQQSGKQKQIQNLKEISPPKIYNPPIRLNSITTTQITVSSNMQNTLPLQSDTSIISNIQTRNKNCPKCGRVKTEKFCICRKGRDDSAPKPGSKFQPGIITTNCRKCFLNRPVLGEFYCRQCKIRLGK